MQCLIDFLIKFDPFPKIFLRLFITLLLILNTIQFNFLYGFSNDSLVIAYRFYPQQLVLAIQFLLQLLSYVVSSFSCCIGAVEDSYLVALVVDVIYQIIQTHLRTHLSDLVALFIFEVEEITWSLYPAIYLV